MHIKNKRSTKWYAEFEHDLGDTNTFLRLSPTLAGLNAEWVAKQIQQIPPLPRINAWDRGWCSSIWSVKFVNLIIFIWKPTYKFL